MYERVRVRLTWVRKRKRENSHKGTKTQRERTELNCPLDLSFARSKFDAKLITPGLVHISSAELGEWIKGVAPLHSALPQSNVGGAQDGVVQCDESEGSKERTAHFPV